MKTLKNRLGKSANRYKKSDFFKWIFYLLWALRLNNVATSLRDQYRCTKTDFAEYQWSFVTNRGGAASGPSQQKYVIKYSEKKQKKLL